MYEAHGGRLGARNNPDGGATLTFHAAGGETRCHKRPGAGAWCPWWTMTRPCAGAWRGWSRRRLPSRGIRLGARVPRPSPGRRPRLPRPDVRMPGLTGLDLQETLTTAAHSTSIIFITGYGDVPRKREGHEGRGGGFSDQAGRRRGAPRGHQAGGGQGQCGTAGRGQGAGVRERIKTVTPREADVFALVVTGMLNKLIAVDLGVSEKMVQVHRGRVMEKMRARSLAELVRLADEGGVVSAKP